MTVVSNATHASLVPSIAHQILLPPAVQPNSLGVRHSFSKGELAFREPRNGRQHYGMLLSIKSPMGIFISLWFEFL